MNIFAPTNFKRAVMYLVADILFIAISVYLSFLLRFDFDIPRQYIYDIPKAFILLSLIRILLFYFLDLFRVSWRYFGFKDHIKVLYTLLISTILFLFFIFILRGNLFLGFPRSVTAIEFFISLFLFSTFRMSKRALLELFNSNSLATPTLVVASTKDSEEITRSLMKDGQDFRVVAIWNEEAKGTRVNNIKVMGIDEIRQVYDGLECAIVGGEYSAKSIYNELDSLGIGKIKVFQRFHDKRYALEDISVEDLLARKPKDLDTKVISSFVTDKVVLITGAGGSIGSELSRQVASFGARQIILVDHGEFNLYQISESLSEYNIVSVMIDIKNKANLDEIMALYRPGMVIHAAAYKHVPLCEENPASAVANNIQGSMNLIDLSIKYKVDKVVIISTDKAVRPTNVMGATKRVVELYADNVSSEDTDIVAVRFGNVLGSSGSVIPKFKEQISRGGPVTVTHPDINRYFMLIPEACQLVLQAAAIAKGGELFVLDMGEPIRIVDLARQMIRLHGKEDEIEIEFTGLRAGEKLYEELLLDDGDSKTRYSSIFIATPTAYDIVQLREDIAYLMSSNDKVKALQKIVPEFAHENMV